MNAENANTMASPERKELEDGVTEIIDKLQKKSEEESGNAIQGSPFICRFDEPQEPIEFIKEVRTSSDPWRMFGVYHQLRKEQVDDNGDTIQSSYYRLLATLCHVEDEKVTGNSQINMEIWDKAFRVYVKEECDPSRVTEFLELVNGQFGISVETPEYLE